MATNLIRNYNQLLELIYRSQAENVQSIRNVFLRDFGAPMQFNNCLIQPTQADGQDTMDRLFNHLTRVVVDEKTNKREFESERAIRIHWIRHLFRNYQGLNHILTFQVTDEKRVYLLDRNERYVIILEPLRNGNAYYLLSAYRLLDSNFRKIMKKYQKRGVPI